MTTHPPLNIATTVALATIVQMAQSTAKVVWLADDKNLMEGTARHICDERGNFPSEDDDIRDQFLRVTTSMGFEVFMPMADCIDRVKASTLVTR